MCKRRLALTINTKIIKMMRLNPFADSAVPTMFNILSKMISKNAFLNVQ